MARPSRLTGFDYRGPHQYSLTFCTRERRPALADPGVASMVLVRIRQASEREVFAILAYCLMPDHVHLLIEGRSPTSEMRRFVKCARQASGQVYTNATGERLWQEGYYDRVLRREEDARDIARYIIANPVRAGLVRSPDQYPYVGSDVWTLNELIEGLT